MKTVHRVAAQALALTNAMSAVVLLQGERWGWFVFSIVAASVFSAFAVVVEEEP